MAKEETKPKVVFKRGPDYLEAKVEPKDLELILNGTDKVNKYQIASVIDKIETGQKIQDNKYTIVGAELPFNRYILGVNGVVEREALIKSLQDFFDATISYAKVYRGSYILIEKLGIHNMGHGEETVYLVSGLVRLLRDKEKLKNKFL
ncbi:MAG: hypothetical protein V1645_01950 [archaeon]